MKFIEEYRDPELVKMLVKNIHKRTTNNWTIMEVCGGQTHSIIRFGIDQLLPDKVTLVHGPGCPVCVTPAKTIDAALEIAQKENVIFTSFGDMLRVPGSGDDLLSIKSRGGDVRIVYSPLDAVQIAQDNPDKEVVFFGVGFETTAPATSIALKQAAQLDVDNFSMLDAHVLVPPAIRTVLSSPECRVQGFLAAGHVCAVTGYEEYHKLAKDFNVPMVVTGFEPIDILRGIYETICLLEDGICEVRNQYRRIVSESGNIHALKMIRETYTVVDREWRGLGVIPDSGWGISDAYRKYDAKGRFDVREIEPEEEPECISGLILQGLKKPKDCPAFGKRCTPEHPLGATMVSSEGACAAYYKYRPNS